MSRPIMLGIVGDSGSARNTVTRGLERLLGEDEITHVCTDDYHRYDRKQRAERNITPLHPDCNYLDILAQDLGFLRDNQPVLKPVYEHGDGTFGPSVYVVPRRLVVAEGLLAFHTPELREMFDVRVYLDQPEDLRRRWKLQRDCSTRGYTAGQVLSELDRREPDSEAFVRPQRDHADVVVAFQPNGVADPEHLDAKLTLRDSLTHPDLSGVLADCEQDGLVLTKRPGAQELYVPGRISSDRATRNRAEQIEELIWWKMHFARPLRPQALGEFTIGTELHHSDSLALVQLLILYCALTARHVVSVAADSPRDLEESALEELPSSQAPVAT
jgi:phosphoribulokinase